MDCIWLALRRGSNPSEVAWNFGPPISDVSPPAYFRELMSYYRKVRWDFCELIHKKRHCRRVMVFREISPSHPIKYQPVWDNLVRLQKPPNWIIENLTTLNEYIPVWYSYRLCITRKVSSNRLIHGVGLKVGFYGLQTSNSFFLQRNYAVRPRPTASDIKSRWWWCAVQWSADI